MRRAVFDLPAVSSTLIHLLNLDVCDSLNYDESQRKEAIMSTQISIRASEDLILKFNALAKETDRSRAYLINQALEEYIARLRGSTNRRCQDVCASTCSMKELNHWSLADPKLLIMSRCICVN